MLVLLAVAFLCLIGITACTKPHVHEFSEWQVVTNATCTENGKEKYTCAACGYFEERDTQALGHNFSIEFTLDTPATCTAEGSKSKHCLRDGCAEKADATAVALLEHTYGGWQVFTPATCPEKGLEKRTCSVCSHFEERDIDALGHDFSSEFTTDTPATCTAAGSKSKHCLHDSCSEKIEVTAISMLEHSYGDWHETTAATCTENGEERHTCSACAHFEERDILALGHDFDDEFSTDVYATCLAAGSKSKHCSRCSAQDEITVLPIKDHFYAWEITVAPTETEDGEKQDICQNGCHDIRDIQILYALGTDGLQFKANSEQTEYSVTGYTGTASIVHVPAYHEGLPVTVIDEDAFNNNMDITEVHMKEGIRQISDNAFFFCMSLSEVTVPDSVQIIGDCAFYACPITSINIGENVSVIGTNAFRYCQLTSIIIPLSVTEIGMSVFTDIDNLTIFTEHTAAQPNWQVYWNSTGKSAYDFHPVYWAGQWHIEEGEPAPHSNGEWQQVTAPTCTEDGLEKRTCSVCGHIEERDIPALGHNFAGEFTVDLAATCTAEGSKSKHCLREGCAEKTEITVIPMTEHPYGEWQEVTAATCTEKGLEKRTCSVCVHFEERDIEALGHDYVWTVTVPPTETEDGVETEICSHDSSHTRGTRTAYATGTSGLTYDYADDDCDKMIVTGLDGEVSEVVIPAYFNHLPVVGIGEYAFRNCGDISSITIGTNITSIGTNAFEGCVNLDSITIPDNVISIGYAAFTGCSGLWSITLPFVGESRTAESSNASFGYIFGSSPYEGSTVATQYPPDYGDMVNYYLPTSLENVTITDPDGLHWSAFYGCTELRSIILPDGVTEIGDHTFRRCLNLLEFHVPDSVTMIGTAAFYSCTSLQSFTVPSGVETIRNYAFWGCGNLSTISIGENVEIIEGDLVFTNTILQYIYCEAPSQPAGWAFGWNPSYATVIWSTDGIERLYSFETDGGSEAPSVTALNVQSAPITEKEGYMIYGWYDNPEFSGEPVTFPYFSKTNLTLYVKWEVECTYTFYDEDGVTELKKQSVFYGSPIVPPEAPTKAATVQYTYTFAGWDKEIPSAITEDIVFIATYNQTLNRYTISFNSNGGSAVAAITEDYGTEVSAPDEPERPSYIFEGWFTDNGTFANLYVFTTVTEDVTLYAKWSEHPGTEGLEYTQIGNEYYVTNYTGEATEVVVPLMYNGKDVTQVYVCAFEFSAVTSVVVGGNVSYIGQSAFASCASLTKVVIPDSVTKIDKNAFSGCTALTQITIPGTVTVIDDAAFRDTALTTVTVPDGLSCISIGLFYNCVDLREVIIGSGITIIYEQAFNYCTSLSTVYYKGTAAQFAAIEVYSLNQYFTAAAKYFYSETEPQEPGNFWHYAPDGTTPVIWE